MASAEYNHREIEHRWQFDWKRSNLHAVEINRDKKKFYVLDMFPYPSGAGLHVGHPLGYIASDIVARYKRQNGFNVLHPMGYDAFGLPAEQYAIETGQHPAETTEENIERYRQQLDRIGFAYDWDREVQTCDPFYYHWTQWIFMQFFNHWYNKKSDKAEHINNLIAIFENEGNVNVEHKGTEVEHFMAGDWLEMTPAEKEDVLQNYRLAFLDETSVNWCEELGTVLANEEVKDGFSERGGYPVVKKKMSQWFLRITAYADRLLNDLESIDWTDSIKEIQRNWIGRSEGARIRFKVFNKESSLIEVFTTRPDTIFGATFMVLAPEHEIVSKITTADQKKEVEKYLDQALKRSERERMSDVKTVTGCFTGAYCTHPFSGEKMPVYIADYVLAGYGTGAIMAVPAHDSRDHAFARKFKLPIKQVVNDGEERDPQKESFDLKEGTVINSSFLNGKSVKDAISFCINKLEELGIGKGEVNFKLRDAGFSRQRFWGEPIPIIYKNGVPTLVEESDLPLELPEVESYEPTGTGESPLAGVKEWIETSSGTRETNTMPGWAGSSWYFLRYMDPENDYEFASRASTDYWNQVDIYFGGSEHATGHLLYARFWTKFLYDLKEIGFKEPFKKLVNQGMIQGIIETALLQKEKEKGLQVYLSADLVNPKDHDKYQKVPVPIEFLHGYEDTENPSYLDSKGIRKLSEWRPELDEAIFKCKDGYYEDGIFNSKKDGVSEGYFYTASELGKMSKSKYNVINPDDICDEYGADSLRLYEMFLGPLEDSKPWNVKGIDGVHRFLRKMWRLFIDQDGKSKLNDEPTTPEQLKTIHRTIKKITADIESMSFNTCVSAFMICANELSDSGCTNFEEMSKLLTILAPFAPHIAEELWHETGNKGSVIDARWPEHNESYLIELTKSYPISVNGKPRTTIEFEVNATKESIESEVLKNEIIQKWLDGKTPKKVIVVPGKIVNVVI